MLSLKLTDVWPNLFEENINKFQLHSKIEKIWVEIGKDMHKEIDRKICIEKFIGIVEKEKEIFEEWNIDRDYLPINYLSRSALRIDGIVWSKLDHVSQIIS